MAHERGFPPEEFAARTAPRAQALMAAHGVDALIVCTEPEVRYFTGFHTPFWQSPTRPWFTVVPVTGKPVAVIPGIGAPSMSATWIDDIRTWSSPRPDDDGVTLLTDTVRETGRPQRHRRPADGPGDARSYATRRPRPAFAPRSATSSMSPTSSEASGWSRPTGEIEKHRRISSIVSDAFDRLPDVVSTGMTERQAFQAFRAEILAQGADDVPYLVGATGPGGIDDIIRQPSDRVITDGDLLIFDTGSTIDGYFSDFDRNFAFTHADQSAKDAYRAVWEATEAGFEACKPGATTSDVFRAMNEVLKANGSLGNDVGRMGHGLGMQVTEWPSHTATRRNADRGEHGADPSSPAWVWAPGKAMVHEENIVVGANGSEWLSRPSRPRTPDHLRRLT